MVILSNFISAFMLISFSWSLGYFCLYERKSDVGKWNGVLWYLLFLGVLVISDMFSNIMYLGLAFIFLTVLLTPLEKFPNGFHHVQNLKSLKK